MYMVSLGVVRMPLSVMSSAEDKCSRAIAFLLCNNIRYRNLKLISAVPIFLLVISLFFKLWPARISITWSKLQFTKIFYANPMF